MVCDAMLSEICSQANELSSIVGVQSFYFGVEAIFHEVLEGREYLSHL